ncbi:Lrp/AsnC ligand binding domain-containing protein [Geminicoccaceae bacterium 1502E]|nr:Lrp/AsnC ligand binding domain-containing protein [Geminicoccaceae bacterium 1502E]
MARSAKYRNIKLDSIDLKILRELQADGRMSFTELAPRVGLTTSPCLERVRRLEQAGVIRGYRADLDPHQLEGSLLVFVELSLTYTSPDIFAEFKRAIGKVPQIMECHLVSGDFDYLIKARIADMNEYRELLGQIVEKLPGVRNSKTLVVMEELKESAAVRVPAQPRR